MRFGRAIGWAAMLGVAASVLPVSAGAAPEPAAYVPPSGSVWIEPGEVPLDPDAASVEILRDDEALAATPGGSRRALVSLGVRLPLLGATRGAGCSGRWLLVGPMAYVCSDKVRLSRSAAGIEDAVTPPSSDALPYKYFFVGKDGGDAFATLRDAEDDTPSEQLERGWSIAGVGEVTHKGLTYVKTRRGRFIPRSQLGAVATFGFHGEELAGTLDIGWVLPDRANVYSEPKTSGKPKGLRTRLQKVEVLERKKVGKDDYLRVGDGEWMRALDVRVPTLAERPSEAGSKARWIDVDTATQTLVAYEGDVPKFATVVSTGRAGSATPKGTFRIWVKLRSATMSNADEATTDDAPAYSIEDVPYVQYFSNGVALHGAFWHRKFGNVTSHGCVNLAPMDAQRLFGWTLPRAPAGWDAVFPTPTEQATIVRVR